MTNAEDVPITEDKPEADVAEQQIPVDPTLDEAGLDPTHIANRSDAQANLPDTSRPSHQRPPLRR